MSGIFEFITQDHDYWLVVTAGLVCVAGSCLTTMTLRRLITAIGFRKRVQLVMSSLITGATIWATHFIAMLAYDPVVEHGYEPLLTGMSLGVAIIGALATNAAFAFLQGRQQYLIAGTLFALTVSVMHYVGMSALQISGALIWNPVVVVTSVLLGAVLGVASFHRIAYPITRFCWLAGSILMVLSIFAMHFTGMSAFEVRPNPDFVVPPQVLSESLLGLLIFSVVTVILFIGFSGISIETNLERESISKLKHNVMHDHLTGLPNRLHLKQKIDELRVTLLRDPNLGVVVVAIDLDHFKQVNELHGQEIGDRVLMVVASRLREVIGTDGFIARAAGNEFVALRADILSSADAAEFVDLIKNSITQVIKVESCIVGISASLGVVTSLGDWVDPDDLMRKANLALFRSKHEIGQSICEYDANMDQQLREKMILIDDLQFALSLNQFELFYQTQNDARSHTVIGCEVLLRWCHPLRGMVSPVEFIPLAEQTGLIQDIGRWVLRTACLEAATWTQPCSVAVNVAPQQLVQPDFVDHLADILKESRLPPERLELEITEASVIRDQTLALKVLNAIKEMGVRIAMDDFGTGYSSLATLQTFPFDKIKIDRRFVTDLHLSHHGAAIVRATLSLGKAFCIPVLAEGVETKEELSFLIAEGCNLVQGFYFSKPVNVEEIRAITMLPVNKIAS